MLVLRLLPMVLSILCLMEGHANVLSSTTDIGNGEKNSAVKIIELNLDNKKKPGKKSSKKPGKKPLKKPVRKPGKRPRRKPGKKPRKKHGKKHGKKKCWIKGNKKCCKRRRKRTKCKRGIRLDVTCDNKNNMKIFADNVQQMYTNNDVINWNRTNTAIIPPNTGTIEIHCINVWYAGGIIASTDNGVKTDKSWRCSADDGNTWKPAFVIGDNGKVKRPNGEPMWGLRENISSSAQWIWADKNWLDQSGKPINDSIICKKKLGYCFDDTFQPHLLNNRFKLENSTDLEKDCKDICKKLGITKYIGITTYTEKSHHNCSCGNNLDNTDANIVKFGMCSENIQQNGDYQFLLLLGDIACTHSNMSSCSKVINSTCQYDATTIGICCPLSWEYGMCCADKVESCPQNNTITNTTSIEPLGEFGPADATCATYAFYILVGLMNPKTYQCFNCNNRFCKVWRNQCCCHFSETDCIQKVCPTNHKPKCETFSSKAP